MPPSCAVSTQQLGDDCERLRKEIWADAGREFNVNSTPQLREVLFDDLGLTPQKKTKTGFSTDAASLEKLAGEHPIIEHLLAYREVEKLRSTYGEGLLNEVQPDGRIHATFNQTVARTGRLSSDAPNLHNIPVRSEVGRAFRRAFVPAEGFEFLVADYNQIELRCIAHLAEDPGLINAFESNADIHTTTAARVFDVDPDAVTIEQRSKAKMVSYGLAYGMEAYGLGQRLGIPTGEAQEILDAYFEAFPAVRAYMERTVAEARERGYTETLFGRRRQIAELSSSNFRIRQAGERQAMNAGIQGLAADIFKVALVRLDARSRAGSVHQPAHPAGARRGDRRGDLGREGRRHGARARRHVGCVRPAGAPRGQPVVRRHVGRRQGLTPRRPAIPTMERAIGSRRPIRRRERGRRWSTATGAAPGPSGCCSLCSSWWPPTASGRCRRPRTVATARRSGCGPKPNGSAVPSSDMRACPP